jgi:hypothetical protein
MFLTRTGSGVLEKRAADGLFKRIQCHLSNPVTRPAFVSWAVQDFVVDTAAPENIIL